MRLSTTERQGGVASTSLSPGQAARRQRIVDAAKELLINQPYEQIQARDVASSAKVALGTLYRYFSSKEHLYAVVVTLWEAPSPERLAPPDLPAIERLRAKVHYVVAAFERQPYFYAAQLSLISSNEPVVRELMSRWSAQSVAWLLEDLSCLPHQRASDLAGMLSAIHGSMLTEAVLHGGSYADATRLIDVFIDIIAPEVTAAEQEQV